MNTDKLDNSVRDIKSVTNIAIVSNAVLSALKFIIGFWAGSIALIADGVHSLTDIVTDLAVFLGVHFGSKAPDAEHPYGHGRFETISAMVVSLVLFVAGATMIYKASMRIAAQHSHEDAVANMSYWVLVAALISIVLKEFLYRITQKVAVKTHSSALHANAWHHRSDAYSSIAVVVGFLSMRLTGYVHGDEIAAIAVGLMIIMVSIKIINGCLHEFVERAVDTETIAEIKKVIEAQPQIKDWHNLRTRTVSREIFIDMHILVDPNLDVVSAHNVAESLELSLHKQLKRPVNITVHVEPDLPELRKPHIR